MTKSKSLVAMLVILIVLAGAYAYISLKPKNDSKAEENSKKIELSKLDETKISKIALSSASGNLEFEKKGDTWSLTSNPGVKLDQAAINALVKSFATLQSDRIVVEDSKELENFGLKAPAVTASAQVEGGGGVTLYLGNKTPQGSTYYLMVKDNTRVYTVSADDGKRFSYTLADVRDKSVANMEAKDINYMSIVNQDGKNIELKKAVQGSAEEQQFGTDAWIMSKPYKATYHADETKVKDMAGKIGEMKIAGFIEQNPADYSKYGLDKPSLDVTVKSNSNQLRLIFGKTADENNIYFRVDGSKEVYTMDKNSMEAFQSKPFDIVDREFRVTQDSNLAKMTIEGLGRSDIYTVARTVVPPSKPEDKATEELKFKLNGKDIEDGDFYLSFNTMMGLSAEAENDKQVEEKPDLKIILDLAKGDKRQVILGFSPYNADFYAVFVDGKSDFLISKQQVNTALGQIKEIEDKYNK